ncbi:MAG: rhomboid family intramembrane serine protease [Armatimonadetes bacterium]|nr:rhomboid family intramembrane serine protease [Armatimonadota bacterium]
MIPIKDNIPSRNYPIVNIALIWANFVVFAIELAAGPAAREIVAMWGMTPARLAHEGLTLATAATFITSMFLHGGWAHVLGNMWFLYIFGDNVEDRMGHGRYLLFYLLGGIAGGVAHFLFNPLSPVPAIGASGAIAAVLGAYYVLFPFARVAALVWLFWIIDIVELPALTFLGAWFLFQFISGLATLPFAGQFVGGVAWWAHVGGFVTGMVLVKIFCRPRERCRFPYDFRPVW